MTTCPKCGGVDVNGPTYCAGTNYRCSHNWYTTGNRIDHLIYRCARCGYECTAPTNDAPKNEVKP